MSSETAAAGSSAAEGLTPAQKLMEQHDHHVTVEDVVDEEDVVHPPPSAAPKAAPSDAPATTMSEKAAGKQKAEDTPAPAKKAAAALNTSSEEAFPALGPAKPRAPASFAATWGKKPASVATNGINGSGQETGNADSRASTPASGNAAPASASGPALQKISLPGRSTERISFYPSQLIPRKDLKKPLNDIIRDINKRSKAKLEYKAGGADGKVIFEATGPVDDVRQSLKQIANELGSKVCHSHCTSLHELTVFSNPSRSRFPRLSAPSSSAVRVRRSRKSASAPAPAFRSRSQRPAKMKTL